MAKKNNGGGGNSHQRAVQQTAAYSQPHRHTGVPDGSVKGNPSTEKPRFFARDIVLAIVCLLIPQGWSMSGLPPSIVWACICWITAAALVVRVIWMALRSWVPNRLSRGLLLAAPVVILICLMWNPVISEYHKEHAAPSLSRTATTDDIAQLKELIAETGSAEKSDKYADKVMAGFSEIMLIRLYGKQVNSKSYLFDVGGQNENRLSAYITRDSALTFMWIDADGEPHPLRANIGEGGIPLNKIFVLICELGIVDGHSVMRIMVNNREIALLDNPTRANFIPIPWYSVDSNNTATLAADRDKKNGGSFDSFGAATYSTTLTNEARDQWLIKMGARITNPVFIRFSGTQWLKADAKTHTGQLSDSSVWRHQ